MTEKKQLSLEPYKGTRDFYPKEQFIQNYIFNVWKKVVESYGYLRYDASILEETDLYRAKSGEEIVGEQTYSFTDRGGRDVTIRPEMTPTVARMVAQKRKELTFPIRWYSIPNLFRYERPQRGRLREHWQLNVDMFGVDNADADVEIISIAYDIMRAFGASDEQFEIRLNSRKVINALNKFHNCSEEQEYKVTRLLDKYEKLKPSEFEERMIEILGSKEEALKYVNDLNTLNNFKDQDGVKKLLMANMEMSIIASVINKLESRGIRNVVFRSTLARGFDYYTGTVFEMFDRDPENPRALFGGGRYDDLVGIFGVEKVPGIGFGMGDVTIKDFLETHALFPAYKPTVDLYMAPFDTSFIEASNELAKYLRSQGLNVAVDLTDRQVSKKVKAADKEQIPFVLVIGEQEVASGKYKIKNFKESKEEEVSREGITSIIKN